MRAAAARLVSARRRDVRTRYARSGKLRIAYELRGIFPELGHLLIWQDPDGFADAVISFLPTRSN